MLNLNTGLRTAACLAALVLLGTSAIAQEIIFDNSDPDSRIGLHTDSGNAEIGDVVTFAPGTGRILTEFRFEYFMAPGASAQAQVFIRAMDTETGFPGTILYDSGISGEGWTLRDGFNTFEATGLSLLVPDSVAWTVRFSGVDEGQEVGLLFFDPPTVGSSPQRDGVDYTIRLETDGSWSLIDHPNVTDNLAAQFIAVPEPTTWALLIGGLATFALIRRRKE